MVFLSILLVWQTNRAIIFFNFWNLARRPCARIKQNTSIKQAMHVKFNNILVERVLSSAKNKIKNSTRNCLDRFIPGKRCTEQKAKLLTNTYNCNNNQSHWRKVKKNGHGQQRYVNSQFKDLHRICILHPICQSIF